jgi:hypothetical protein
MIQKIALLLLIVLCFTTCNKKPVALPGGNEVVVFPNPATDIFSVSFNSSVQALEIQIFDVKGNLFSRKKLDSSNNEQQFSIANQPKGTYQVVVVTPTRFIRVKLVKI